MKAVLVCMNVGVAFLLCSCSFLESITSAPPQGPRTGTPQQSPKAQADARRQYPPKAQPAAQPPPKSQPVIQQSPKAQADVSTPPPPPPVTNNIESVRKVLMGADLAFSRACEERGAPEGFYQFVSLDAVCLLAGELPIQGRDAIKVHFAAGPQRTISWKPRDADVSANGELGYTWGTCESQLASTDGQNPVTYAKYVIVWKKQTDGEWKANLFATSPSPSGQRL